MSNELEPTGTKGTGSEGIRPIRKPYSRIIGAAEHWERIHRTPHPQRITDIAVLIVSLIAVGGLAYSAISNYSENPTVAAVYAGAAASGLLITTLSITQILERRRAERNAARFSENLTEDMLRMEQTEHDRS